MWLCSRVNALGFGKHTQELKIFCLSRMRWWIVGVWSICLWWRTVWMERSARGGRDSKRQRKDCTPVTSVIKPSRRAVLCCVTNTSTQVHERTLSTCHKTFISFKYPVSFFYIFVSMCIIFQLTKILSLSGRNLVWPLCIMFNFFHKIIKQYYFIM